jgi:hypothetical protein
MKRENRCGICQGQGVGPIHSAEVRIEPEFTAPVLELESHGEFHLIPLQIIAIVITFAGPSAILLAWRRLRRSNA